MKKIMFLFFLSLFVFGHAHRPNSKIGGADPMLGSIEKQPFLSTYIKGDRLFLNIPDHVLDKPIMFTCYGRLRRSYMQVAWSKHNTKIVLKRLSITSTAGIVLPIKKELVLKDNVLATFPIDKTKSGSGDHCIDITDLVLNQELEWPQKFGVSFGNPVPQLSMLLDTKDMDGEVLIKVRRGMVKFNSKVSIPIFYGFSALGPPMKARRFDFRMGFYGDEKLKLGFGLKNGLANIVRWRLVKKYSQRRISVPLKPITFFISPEVPEKWRPYLKAGIEEWLPAFESAGFKDALVVKEVDSLDEWQAHSIHSNVVYWNQKKYMRGSEYEDYGGTIGHIIDDRTGEVLRGDIFMGASVRTVAEDYFVRAAPLDKRAQQFPFPDELIGELFQSTAAHEAGHVFGIEDANYGEYSYPWDKMNDSLWLRTMGYTPSIMNYTRPSDIPQPEDSIPPPLLIQHVGPTDRYNIQWAYTEFPEGTSMQAESAALERMVRWQDSVPWYRFNKTQLERIGPTTSNEVVETNAPVRSTKLALKNMERVIGMLPNAVKDQNDNGRLGRLYAKTLELWNSHMIHVLSLIGGYDIHYKSLDQAGRMYEPIPWEDQIEALDFLLAHAFEAPDWLTNPSFLMKTRYSTFPDKVLEYQQGLIVEMLTAQRLKRIEFLEGVSGHESLVNVYLTRLQRGLFKTLSEDFGHTDRRRQALQKTYIKQLVMLVGQEAPIKDVQSRFFVHSDYTKGQLMQQLMDLKEAIEKGIQRNKGADTLGHWQLCLNKINTVL